MPNVCKQSKTPICLALKYTEAAVGILCINLERLWISPSLYRDKIRVTENVKTSSVCTFPIMSAKKGIQMLRCRKFHPAAILFQKAFSGKSLKMCFIFCTQGDQRPHWPKS